MLLHIGFDDTDSPSGGCTTYIAALLIDALSGLGARFVDYPNLLRLNPNVPWKTRGNGAVCLRVDIEESREEDALRSVLALVESHADFDCDNTNPGVVFLEGTVPTGLVEFSERVVRTVVSLDDALKLADEHGASAIGFKNMRGIIGGLAAVGGLRGTSRSRRSGMVGRRVDHSVWRWKLCGTGPENSSPSTQLI